MQTDKWDYQQPYSYTHCTTSILAMDFIHALTSMTSMYGPIHSTPISLQIKQTWQLQQNKQEPPTWSLHIWRCPPHLGPANCCSPCTQKPLFQHLLQSKYDSQEGWSRVSLFTMYRTSWIWALNMVVSTMQMANKRFFAESNHLSLTPYPQTPPFLTPNLTDSIGVPLTIETD